MGIEPGFPKCHVLAEPTEPLSGLPKVLFSKMHFQGNGSQSSWDVWFHCLSKI